MRSLLQYILKIMARLVLKKYRPVVIGITGSVGKTSVKELVHLVLAKKFAVRSTYKNYNTEIGLPLTILGIQGGGGSAFAWIKEFFKVIRLLVFRADYPRILVLEMAADKPGDIKYLADLSRPVIGIINAIGEIPVHVEFFKTPAQVLREKANLVLNLPKDGLAVLNYDDEKVRGLKNKIKSRVVTYGFGEGADVRASYYNFSGDSGVSFKVDYQGNTVPFRLPYMVGRQQVYAALAAICAGLALNVNAVQMAESFADFRGIPGRMRLLKGIKKTVIIDDSYNASPISMTAALNALNQFAGRRKVAILGDMLELGNYSEKAHRQIGEKAARICDLLFTVGFRAKFIGDEAEKNSLSKKKMFSFATADEAKLEAQKQVKEDDVILIKGSRAIKMEKIVEEIAENPREIEWFK